MSQNGTFGPDADDLVEAVLAKHARNGAVESVAELIALVLESVAADSSLGQWMLAELVKADLWMASENQMTRSLSFYVGDGGIWQHLDRWMTF